MLQKGALVKKMIVNHQFCLLDGKPTLSFSEKKIFVPRHI